MRAGLQTMTYILLPLCMSILSASNCLAMEDCKQPYQHDSRYYWRTAYIETTGRFCLTFDVVQPRVFDIHAGEPKSLAGESLLSISYPSEYVDERLNKKYLNPPRFVDAGVDIDLRGHELKSVPENLIGIKASSLTPHIKVSNGSIDVPGNRRPNFGIDFEHTFTVDTIWKGRIDHSGKEFGPGNAPESINLIDEDLAPREIAKKYLTWPIADPTQPLLKYKNTQHLVEHMIIHAGWRGVVMGGGGNVLRDSAIDVDGHTAIYMYGPGSIIENNTIIIHGKGDAKPFDAAIKLRDAYGAVVRNNRIIYKGGLFGKAPAAVNLLDSTDVLIEGNTVENFDKLVRVNGDRKYAEKGNSLK